MLKLLPLVLIAIGYAALMWHLSLRRTRAELDRNSTPLVEPRLLALAERLSKAMGKGPVRVHVYEIPAVNGLAAPDGRIFLTRGFLNRYVRGEVSDLELASVIAHELGHVHLGHSKRRMIDFAGQNAVRTLLVLLFSRVIPGLGVWIADAVTGLVAARMSRQDEFEADAWATALLMAAGIGAAPQLSLFRKLEHLTGGAGANAPAWLLSHPPVEARIRAIEANVARWTA